MGEKNEKLFNVFVVLSVLTLGFLAATGYTSRLDSKRWDRSCQASEIIGLWVMNHQEKYLGRVQDLVFDPKRSCHLRDHRILDFWLEINRGEFSGGQQPYWTEQETTGK